MRNVLSVAGVSACAILAVIFTTFPARAQESGPPVAAIGHGAFVDATGRQIVPTEKFIGEAIAWYRSDVAKRVPADRVALNERQLGEARRSRVLNVNQRLFLEMRAADGLYASAQRLPADDRNRRALNAFAYLLRFELPKSSADLYGAYARRLDLGADFESFLQRSGFGAAAVAKPLSATTKSGLAYINECRSHGVPIPPPIGDSRWISRGFIPRNQLFLRNTSVEVMTFTGTGAQEGLCIALPRSNDTNPADGVTVALDGVVCLGKRPSPISGKSTVCFWDNQMNGASFDFLKGERIPIGWNDPAQVSPNPSGRFMSGGAQLTSIGAGMCSDCHAGQNPFIVHPNTVLGQLGKAPLNLPMFGDTWYDPLVLSSWPQNEKRLNDVYAPADCQGCHTGGSAGRLPHISTGLSDYCVTILQNAVRGGVDATGQPINPTMPPSSPGSAANAADVKVLTGPPGTMPLPFCNLAPTAGPANRGDPHIVSTNGIAFDFQAAGEFVALTEGDGSFELQTRQSPVQTNFTPGTNPYTGLASCVALNTAVSLRMGKNRVTYQPVGQGDNGARMLLRINGQARFLERGQKLDLGQGNFIADNSSGGSLTFGWADGTRVIATPRYWETQGYWYLDIEVIGTTARAGIMGHIGGGEWLPRGGDGSNYGPRPVALADRAAILHGKFANSWRVTDKTSLFDYENGQTTKSFTDPAWALSSSCRKSALPAPMVREPASYDVAKQACSEIQDKQAREQCIFDTQVMNDLGVVKAYLRTLSLRKSIEATIK